MSISIVVVDDNNLYRQGVRTLLETTPDFRIVGEADNGLDAFTMAELLHPDVIVLDWVMPGLSGLEVTQLVHKCIRDTHVIIVSQHDDDTYVQLAVKSGACGFILKEDAADHLEKAIRAAAAGQHYFSPSLDVKGNGGVAANYLDPERSQDFKHN